jgi:hypothetical protein
MDVVVGALTERSEDRDVLDPNAYYTMLPIATTLIARESLRVRLLQAARRRRRFVRIARAVRLGQGSDEHPSTRQTPMIIVKISSSPPRSFHSPPSPPRSSA